ncbi:MAG: carbohydrate kinase family protein [Candidatus Pacebacteria bacterium]|nr:carbohydrate kinase family protein [Candidatus Paceibacterota bacterium]
MFDVITFGSATRDVFLRSDNFEEIKEEKIFLNKRGVCFNLGAKIPISEIDFFSGGGGTNSAFTFKKQGLKVSYCGKIGDDYAGKEIKNELRKNGISTKFISSIKEKHTNYSVFILTKSDRTGLIYKGASEELKKNDVPWNNLKTNWFYVAPLSGKLKNLTSSILSFAKKKKIKTFMNPGNSQLSLKKEQKKRLFNMADILLLNQEEASIATGISYRKEKEIFKTLDEWVEGIVIMTKGPFGAVVSDGNFIYEVGVLPIKKIVDRTGCGDAFGSGFLVGLVKKIKNNPKKITPSDMTLRGVTPSDIEYAIQHASANAVSCIGKTGAKNGILGKNESIWKQGKVKIKISKLK